MVVRRAWYSAKTVSRSLGPIGLILWLGFGTSNALAAGEIEWSVLSRFPLLSQDTFTAISSDWQETHQNRRSMHELMLLRMKRRVERPASAEPHRRRPGTRSRTGRATSPAPSSRAPGTTTGASTAPTTRTRTSLRSSARSSSIRITGPMCSRPRVPGTSC